MDIRKVEKFILQRYTESEAKSDSDQNRPIWVGRLMWGLGSCLFAAFIGALSILLLSALNINFSLRFFAISISLVLVTAIISVKYCKRKIVQISDVAYEEPVPEFSPEELAKKTASNNRIAKRIIIGVHVIIILPLVILRQVAPDGPYDFILITLGVIMALSLAFYMLFWVSEFFYKIYLIKKYCPYLVSIEDRRYDRDTEERASDDSGSE